ncbi:hypothetical protein JD77_01689 [Micromonospora olivasterospora]|uniref:Uncharacterized protein n=1 Tax=Micromonospora olivasterospora TaxID=1880 RepID=A0A562I6U3_MICOL|nr:hypothetical protein JD77_01689 [Micromonospora olivasterospora]
MCSSTVASQEANVGIPRLELPQATRLIDGSSRFIARAVSAASRPYSCAVLWPTCHGPSNSLPRHHNRTPYGCSAPCLRRRSDSRVPPGWLAYSSRSQASCTPRVPRLTVIIGSTPAAAAQVMNSSSPNALVSTVFQARSRRRGRSPTGPTPSSQR